MKNKITIMSLVLILIASFHLSVYIINTQNHDKYIKNHIFNQIRDYAMYSSRASDGVKRLQSNKNESSFESIAYIKVLFNIYDRMDKYEDKWISNEGKRFVGLFAYYDLEVYDSLISNNDKRLSQISNELGILSNFYSNLIGDLSSKKSDHIKMLMMLEELHNEFCEVDNLSDETYDYLIDSQTCK